MITYHLRFKLKIIHIKKDKIVDSREEKKNSYMQKKGKI